MFVNLMGVVERTGFFVCTRLNCNFDNYVTISQLIVDIALIKGQKIALTLLSSASRMTLISLNGDIVDEGLSSTNLYSSLFHDAAFC